MNERYLNCWEYQGCGREPGGHRSASGVCPAATVVTLDGMNHGRNGGRSCWVIEGTLCDGYPHGDFERKRCECAKCSFMKRVEVEEGLDFISIERLLLAYEGQEPRPDAADAG